MEYDWIRVVKICVLTAFLLFVSFIEAADLMPRQVAPEAGLTLGLDSEWSNQEGHKRTVDISRARQSVNAGLFSGTSAAISAHMDFFEENPEYDGRTYDASGGGLDARLSGGDVLFEIGVSLKNYDAGEFSDTETGYARFHARCHDLLFTMCVERRDVISSYFSIIQNIQADVFGVSISNAVTEPFRGWFDARYLDLNDWNEAWELLGGLSYRLGETADQFIVGADAEYLDYRSKSWYLLFGGEYAGMIHPYWSPQGYWAGRASLEWRHFFFFNTTPAESGFYSSVKVSAGRDSDEDNRLDCEAGLVLCGQYPVDLQVSCTLTRSGEFDAESLGVSLLYRY